MTDTAQPVMAAETDPVALAAAAFKSAREPEATVNRDDSGRFASQPSDDPDAGDPDDPDAVIDAGDDPDAGDPADNDADPDDPDAAAGDPAQPDPVEMPASWSGENAELWTTLPPEAQAKIAEREGQRDAAVNAKFQEAANLRKAHEAEISEAQANRTRYAEAIDTVLSLVAPQKPPVTMLNPQSSDYDPDAYHLAHAQFEEANGIIETLKAERSDLTAQEQKDAEKAEKLAYEEVETKARPAFIGAYPDVTDAAKAGPFFNGLVNFAVERGVPAQTFENGLQSITSAEWHIIADAMAYRTQQAAKARVEPTARPKPANVPMRPGVTTPRATAKQQAVNRDLGRLNREGTIEAGAALWKHFR